MLLSVDREVRLLPPELANQIAAGEVVERPSSIVKELIENSLDAEAKRITIGIRGGGIDWISVADDGVGMNEENARRALLRHATSKLREFEDLGRLHSYGFRGEALPSIASVSRFSLETRAVGLDHGVLLEKLGGELTCRVLGRPIGTTITVEELFHNVPARRKFLKSSGTEAAQISEVVLEAALSRPEIAFELARDGRAFRSYPRTSGRAERAEMTWEGVPLLHLHGERGPLRVEGYLAPAASAQKGASGLKLIVNGRAIKDRGISGTVAHAASEHLPRGYYPRGVLYIDLPAELVDINVHPQKLEVRFAESRPLLDALHSAVARLYADASTSSGKDSSSLRFDAPSSRVDSFRAPAFRASTERKPADREVAPLPRQNARPLTAAEPRSVLAVSPEPSLVETSTARPSALVYLGQHARGFLVAMDASGVHAIDPHSLAEVVLYEALRTQLLHGEVAKKQLLFPTKLALTTPQFHALEKCLERFSLFGFDVRLRADQQIQLLAMPLLLEHAEPAQLLAHLVDVMVRLPSETEPSLSSVLPKMACLGATKWDPANAQTLLESYQKQSSASECLHGRVMLGELWADELVRKMRGEPMRPV